MPISICNGAVVLVVRLAHIVHFLDYSFIILLKQMNPEHNHVQLVSALCGIQHMSHAAALRGCFLLTPKKCLHAWFCILEKGCRMMSCILIVCWKQYSYHVKAFEYL